MDPLKALNEKYHCKVQRYIEKRNLKQYEVAHRMKVNPSCLCRFLKKKSEWSLGKIITSASKSRISIRSEINEYKKAIANT